MTDGLHRRAFTRTIPLPSACCHILLGVTASILMYDVGAHVDELPIDGETHFERSDQILLSGLDLADVDDEFGLEYWSAAVMAAMFFQAHLCTL